MNSKNLKKITDLLKYGDGKFLVVEDGEPAFVVMNIEQFKRMKQDEEDYDFDPEEYMRNLDWKDDERYRINRAADEYSSFYDDEFDKDDFDQFDEDFHSEEDDEEGFSPDDIPFEDFLKAQGDVENVEKQEQKKDEIVIEPISNSDSSENLEKPEAEKQEKSPINLSDIPF